MFDVELGPLDVVPPPPALDLFSAPIFLPIVDDLTGIHAHGLAVLPAAAADVAGDGVPDLDGAYAATAAQAEGETAAQLAAGVDSPLGALTGAGDGATIGGG